MAQKPKPKVEVDMSFFQPGMLVWVEQINPAPEVEAFLKGTVKTVIQAKQALEVVTIDDKKDVYDVSRILERAEFGKTMEDGKQQQKLSGFADMVNMEILNDAELLENVRKRFIKDLIFTYVGPTLLVVNPFKKIPIMSLEETRMDYIKHIIPSKDPLAYKEKPPNVYAIACEAYRSLFENEKNQAIVISGESGAGKTENAKFCMSLLTSIGSFELFKHDPKILDQEFKQTQTPSRPTDILKVTLKATHQEDVSIEDKILNCNPILEAFGNSKTKRNNNSSRFGKYVSMVVDKRIRKIKGAEIENYLLEKSRIIHQGHQERNFHIFYHMLEGSTPEDLTNLRLMKNNKKYDYDWFEYLKKPQNFVSPGINDVELFHEINRSFQQLGMQDYMQAIYQCVSAVLLLGNVYFDNSTFGNESSCSIKGDIMVDVSFLLGCDQKALTFAMTYRNRKVGNQVINSPLTQAECDICRDSLAKEVYERLFNWLVVKLNKTIKPSGNSTYINVGLLDIYGFEVFEVNTFEQLMINFTNEKLHQLYIQYVFKEEERVFINEGLQKWCSQIKFSDNGQVIELMEKAPIGIFNLLDESCSIASHTDEALLQKIRTSQKGNPLLINPRQPTNPTFTIVHTAKDVEYNITGFRAKNKDETSVVILEAMAISQNKLIAEMFVKSDVKGDKYLGTKIRKEMSELMKELNSCDVHFIRCLKPNEVKKCNIFHQSMTLNQIRYLGVLDSLKVRKDSYPIRRPFDLFYKQYGDISKDEPYAILKSKNITDMKPYALRLIQQFFSSLPPEHFLIGQNKVFMRQQGLSSVKAIYDKECEHKERCVIKVQRAFRAKKFRKKVNSLMQKIKTFKQKMKYLINTIRMRKYAKYITKIQRWVRKKIINWKRKKLLDTAKVIQAYVKRRRAVKLANYMIGKVIKLQRWIKRLIQDKQKRKIRWIQSLIKISIDAAWIKILDKYAIKIQKVWRGWLCRNKLIGKQKMTQIKEAGIQAKIRKNALLLTKWARGYLVRKRIKQMRLAASYIQGYFRMLWLSSLFQAMRKSARLIQKFVRMYLAKKKNYREKYDRYVAPWERQYLGIREKEEQNLFGTIETQRMVDLDLSISQVSSGLLIQEEQGSFFMSGSVKKSPNQRYEPDFQQSLFSSRQQAATLTNPNLTPKVQLKYIHNIPHHWSYESSVESYDSILYKEQESQVLNTKIYLFSTVVDLELLADPSEIYLDPWTKTYKELTNSLFTKQVPIQLFEVGETFTLAVAVNGKAYSWGLNDEYQLGRDYHEKPGSLNLPFDFKIKQISSGENHSLILGHDGTVWSFGSNKLGQLGLGHRQVQTTPQQISIEPIAVVQAVGNTSFAVSQKGSLYSWPLGNSYRPYNIELNSKSPVVNVSCGNQFAIIVQANGCLSSFGENLEGELGLGDTTPRGELCLIDKLASAGEKIIQVDCGFKHVIAKSNLGKIYSWGWGQKGQLGHNQYGNELIPRQLQTKEKVLQVAAGHKCSLILTNNYKIFWCGTNRSINYQSFFVELKIEVKSLHLNMYTPVRLYPSWSRSLSIISVTFANTKNVLDNNIQMRNKVLNQMITKWNEFGIQCVDPPLVPQIAVHIQEKHMKKIPLINNNKPQTPKKGSSRNDGNITFRTPIRISLNPSKVFDRRTTPLNKQPHDSTNGAQTRVQTIQNSDKDIIEDNAHINRLKEIKKRLVRLRKLTQEQWTESDHEFIRTIYKSNLQQLLDTINL